MCFHYILHVVLKLFWLFNKKLKFVCILTDYFSIFILDVNFRLLVQPGQSHNFLSYLILVMYCLFLNLNFLVCRASVKPLWPIFSIWQEFIKFHCIEGLPWSFHGHLKSLENIKNWIRSLQVLNVFLWSLNLYSNLKFVAAQNYIYVTAMQYIMLSLVSSSLYVNTLAIYLNMCLKSRRKIKFSNWQCSLQKVFKADIYIIYTIYILLQKLAEESENMKYISQSNSIRWRWK